jgi:hypothetical protein
MEFYVAFCHPEMSVACFRLISPKPETANDKTITCGKICLWQDLRQAGDGG